MKPRSAPSQFLTLAITSALLALTVSACAPGFETNLNDEVLRPPASSDPLTAEDQRRWDAAERSEVRVAPVLESDFERESFMDDVTEQKPKYTDDQLAEEAEKSYTARQKPRPANTPPNSGAGSPSSATKGSPSKGSNSGSPTGSNSGSPTGSNSGSPTGSNSGSPAAGSNSGSPAGSTTAASARPLPPPLSLRSAFCESLNVTSASSKTDTSHLYNSKASTTTSMPSKELASADPQDKKNRFVCLILPMAIRMNEEVFRMRMEVLRLQAKSKKSVALTSGDQEWLVDMSKTYGVKDVGNFDELLKRVDIIPLPLLLAQAAIESGWGTSRATNDLRNIFGIHAVRGQKCKVGYDTNNACVREFETLEGSVSAYIQLINSSLHYAQFREARSKMRKAGESLDSVKLLATLGKYNETPVQYIRNVREIMTGSNKLTQFVFKEEQVQLQAP